MWLIVLTVFFSVAVSLLLKIGSKKTFFSLAQAIAVNYVTALLLDILYLHPNWHQVFHHQQWLCLILGIFIPTLFLILGQAIKKIGIAKADTAQRLALIIPVLCAFLLFHETIKTVKLIAVGLAFLAIFLLFIPEKNARNMSNNKESIFYFYAVMIGFGIVDSLFKALTQSGLSTADALVSIFFLADILLFTWLLLNHTKWHVINIKLGILIGIANFANIYFYLEAHRYFANNPTLVFTAVNLGVIIFAVLIARSCFKERLTPINYTGISLAIIALWLLSNAANLS